MKRCTKCGVDNPLTEFYLRVRRGGQHRNSTCKECDRATAKAFRVAHPDTVRAVNRAWRAANPEKVKAMKRRNRVENIGRELAHEAARRERYHLAHPDENAAYLRAWKKENAARVNEYCAARKARRRNATPAWADKRAIAELYDLAQRRTINSGFPWHVDHVVPLIHPLVQGLHVEHNLQVVPGIANIRKGNRFWPDMPGDSHV